ncbi:MAG TPA: hypothetical protein VN699_05810, partial [Pirellulales bacterium]|nr:hypothetical protein [Pirellulales bacterium]
MSSPTAPRRRRLQFSLSGILLLTALVGAWLGPQVNRARRQREVVALIKQFHGELAYDYERDRNGKPPGPKWLRDWLGMDYFVDLAVVRVPGVRPADPRLASIGALKRLVELDLHDGAVDDEIVRQFGGLLQLQKLDLGGTQLTDAGLASLSRLTELQELNVSRTGVTDAGLKTVGGLHRLEVLGLAGNAINDHGLCALEPLNHLKNLDLANTQASDQGIDRLNALSELAVVGLPGSRVTEAGLKQLKAFGTLEKPIPRVVEILKVLLDKTELEFDRQPLSDVCEYLEERHNIQVFLDRRTIAGLAKRDEPVITANARWIPLNDALILMLEPLDLTYTIRHEVLFISKRPLRGRTRIAESANGAASTPKLRETLERPAALEFVDQPLGDVLVFVRNAHDVEIRLDERALPLGVGADDILQRPATLNVREISLRSALELLFD